MALFLKWSEVDATIQNKMSSQAPSQSKRLEAMRDTFDELSTEYDIETTKRTDSISVVTDGSAAYDISTFSPDVKEVDSLIFPDNTDSGEMEFRKVSRDQFDQHMALGIPVNEFCLYFEDGVRYLKVNSANHSSVAETLTMVYWTWYRAINGSNAIVEEISADASFYILLPSRFKNLMVYGCLEKLYPMALGEEGEGQAGKYRGMYAREKKNLGLAGLAQRVKSQARKVKIHNPY